MSNLISILAMVCWVFWAFLSSAQTASHDLPYTGTFSYGRQVAEVTDARLEKVTGMAASRKNKGFLWVHNNHGDGARFFLMDTLGHVVRTFYLKNGSNHDWEDMAIGPGPVSGRNYIYIGDIGYINYKYTMAKNIDIYRFEEPSINAKDSLISTFDKFDLQYPDTTHDAQALMVDPVDQGIYVMTYLDSSTTIYRAPRLVDFNKVVPLKLVGKLPFHQITAADISSNGDEIIMKNYIAIFYWKRHAGQSIMDALLQDHDMIRYSKEPRGLAMAWNADGTGFYTLSALAHNKKRFLYYYPKIKK